MKYTTSHEKWIPSESYKNTLLVNAKHFIADVESVKKPQVWVLDIISVV